MTKATALPASALYRRTDLDSLPFETTDELEELDQVLGQARAVQALRFGVGMTHPGYNLFVLGPPGLGKHAIVDAYLKQQAVHQSRPHDWCYVNNFAEPNRPRLLRLPAGLGRRLRAGLRALVEELLVAIPSAFEDEDYQRRSKTLARTLEERQEEALSALQERAEAEQVALLRTPAGFAFAPIRDGEVMSPKDFGRLSDEEKARIEKPVARLQEELQGLLSQFPLWHKEVREQSKQLNRETAAGAVHHETAPLKARYAELPAVLDYLHALEQDVIEHFADFREGPEGQIPDVDGPEFRRYQVNVLVDHGDANGAPVIYEDNPVHDALVGRSEHLAHMGTLVTDFMLIRPGALHRANGGYLVLDARKVLTQPLAWEALKRALFAREVCVESLAQAMSLISSVTLEPEPMPLDVKVVLLGDRMLYYLLHEYDPEFGELFKVASDFEEQIDRSAENTRLFARFVASVVKRDKLRPFARAAVARVIEHAARSVEDSEKLTTRLVSMGDLLREADYWAGLRGVATVEAEDVAEAIAQQVYRADRIPQQILEEIRRGTLMVDTEGERLSQVNGLSILELGRFLFGHPVRITATARLGEGDVVDIEREVELGGSLHSKGILILVNFIGARYATERPLSLTASLVFEQSYGFIEGDSASMAELCALLSTLAELPLQQGIAVTGSVNQHGEAQAIGGVNEKIEGFFDLCHARGLSGTQGVIIPTANVKHLMLREDVVAAAAAGRFHVYAVKNVDEAMAILTGRVAGERDANGEFPEDSINGRIEARLLHMAEQRHEFVESKIKVEHEDGDADSGD